MVAIAGLIAGWFLAPWAARAGARLPRWALAVGAGAVCALPAFALHPLPRQVLGAAVAVGLWLVAAIDLHAYRIPNVLVGAIAAVGVVAQVAGVAFARPLASALVGAAVLLVFALLVIASRGGFGWGDAKLAAALAWVLGPAGAWIALAATGLAGGVVAGLLLAARRRGLRDPVPFAPFFLVGGLWAMLILAR